MMSTTEQSDWIAFSDHAPAGQAILVSDGERTEYFGKDATLPRWATHWLSVAEPPKQQPTQAYVDAQFAANLKDRWSDAAYIPRCDILRVVEKTLEWERAQVRDLLKGMVWGRINNDTEIMIRADAWKRFMERLAP